MFETDAELWSALQQMSRTVNQVVAASKPIAKALDKMGDVASLNRQDYVADALNAIQHADLAPYGGADSYAALIRGLEDRLRTLRTTARQDLIAGLNATAPKPDQIKMVSDSPLVLYVHPLTLEVNFEQCKTTWSYAREPMAQSSLDPSDIWNVYGELLDQFRAARIDSKSFWQALKAAYDFVLLTDAKPAVDLIDIVDVLVPMAWNGPHAVQLKKATQFPRYLLAYQIQKLRQDGLIAHNGYRLDLGTATGGSTKNKANVLFIPMGPTEGQYYLTMCFRRE